MLQPKASIRAFQKGELNGAANHPVQDWETPPPESESARDKSRFRIMPTF
jgi:hypothetical protein